jgi:hypothetical protein
VPLRCPRPFLTSPRQPGKVSQFPALHATSHLPPSRTGLARNAYARGVRLLEAAQCFIATLGRLVSCSHESARPWLATRCLHTPSATTDQNVGARVLANARLNQILQTGKST